LNGSVTTGALFTSIATGNWEDATTWNQGVNVPNAASDIIIAGTHTVTVNSTTASAASVVVNATGALSVTGSTLSVGGTSGAGITNAGTVTVGGGILNLGPTDNSFANRLFTNNGTLTVSSGTLFIAGRLLVNTSSVFNQSGGNINIDGNAGGVAANSVAASAAIVTLNPSTLTSVNLTGGILTIVDPHANSTASNVLTVTGATNGPLNVTTAHTIRFGNGTSTDAGGNAANGFRVDTWATTTGMPFGNVIVEGPTGTNRFVTSTYQQPVFGNVTVNNGGESRIANIYINGNLTVNIGGIFTTTAGLSLTNSTFVDGSSVSFSASPNAQVISGAGTFRNLTTAPTANFTALVFNNSNGSGVTFAAGLTPSLTGTMTVTTGTVTADALSFNGSATQTGDLTAATSIVNVGNVTLNNSVTLSGLGMTNVTGVLNFGNVNAKTLTTAGRLTLKSTTTGTARVADITNAGVNTGNTISGNVIAERFINDVGRRAWRLLSGKPVSGSQTIYDSWQEGGSLAAGKGTWITSTNYTVSNGFDATNVNLSSIATHVQGGAGSASWNYGLANTNVTALSANQGYMLFVRGDRSQTGGNATWNATTLKTTGTLNQGAQGAVTVSSLGTGRTLVGNPYASPIDMETIFTGTANLDQDMYVWDASATGLYGVGAFVLVERNGGTYQQTPFPLPGSPTAAPNSRYIHSGQAFLLRATGTDASVVITEGMKTGNLSVLNPIVNTAGDQQIVANLMIVNGANDPSLADGLRVRFDGTYKANTTDDILKMGNFAENISSYREAKKLIVEKRPMIQKTDTIFLRITNTGVKNYRFQIGTIDFVQTNVTAFLQDTWLNTNKPLNLDGSVTNVDFSITANPASANQDRFRIVFAAAAPLPAAFTNVKAAQENSHIAVEWKVTNQRSIAKYELEKSTDGVNFTKVNTQQAVTATDATYNWLDVNPVLGNNYYRIRSIGVGTDVKISQVVKVVMGKGIAPAITIYPNPVVNKTVTMLFTNMEKGVYQLRLFNTMGQLVLARSVNHTGGTAMQALVFDKGIAKGNYRLEIVKPDNSKISQSIIITE